MFKKLFVLCLIPMLLCGCKNKKSATPVINNISFTAEISYNSSEFSGNVTIANDNLILIITEPNEVKGLTFTATKNGITAKLKGILYELDSSSMPHMAVVKILYNVFEDISAITNIKGNNNDNCVLTGRVNGCEYRYYVTPTGLPISLYIDDINLKIIFKNISIK